MTLTAKLGFFERISTSYLESVTSVVVTGGFLPSLGMETPENILSFPNSPISSWRMESSLDSITSRSSKYPLVLFWYFFLNWILILSTCDFIFLIILINTLFDTKLSNLDLSKSLFFLNFISTSLLSDSFFNNLPFPCLKTPSTHPLLFLTLCCSTCFSMKFFTSLVSNFSLTREESHLLLCSVLQTSTMVSPKLLRNEEMSLSAILCSDMVFTMEIGLNQVLPSSMYCNEKILKFLKLAKLWRKILVQVGFLEELNYRLYQYIFHL